MNEHLFLNMLNMINDTHGLTEEDIAGIIDEVEALPEDTCENPSEEFCEPDFCILMNASISIKYYEDVILNNLKPEYSSKGFTKIADIINDERRQLGESILVEDYFVEALKEYFRLYDGAVESSDFPLTPSVRAITRLYKETGIECAIQIVDEYGQFFLLDGETGASTTLCNDAMCSETEKHAYFIEKAVETRELIPGRLSLRNLLNSFGSFDYSAYDLILCFRLGDGIPLHPTTCNEIMNILNEYKSMSAGES